MVCDNDTTPVTVIWIMLMYCGAPEREPVTQNCFSLHRVNPDNIEDKLMVGEEIMKRVTHTPSEEKEEQPERS